MKGIPRGKYTKEFRQEAVKMVIEEKWCYYGGSSDEYKSSKDFLNCCEKQSRREAVG